MGDAIMVTNMRMGNARVTHKFMVSVRGMSMNMVRAAMAATATNTLALRNVGLADGNVASLICFQQRQANPSLRWEVGKLMREAEFR